MIKMDEENPPLKQPEKMAGRQQTLSWQFLLCLLLTVSMGEAACPNTRECDCEIVDGRMIINCRYQNPPLTEVPQWNADPNDAYHELSLGGNQISILRDRAFDGLNIQKLDISDNRIDLISDQAFVGLEDVLLELVLHVSQMQQFPVTALARLSQLEALHVKGFDLDSLPSGALTSLSVRDLALEECGLTRLSAADFTGLELHILMLSGNALTDLPTAALAQQTQLQVLNIAHNEISKLSTGAFQNNAQLTELDLSNNQINTIQEDAFLGLENSLTNLNLQHNKLTSFQVMPIGGITRLEKLNLGYNPLSVIPTGAFISLSSLWHLNLHSCQLSQLTAGMFQGAESTLQILLLADNRITSISSRLFESFQSLNDLNLDLNPNLGPGLDQNTFSGLEGVLQTLNLEKVGFTDTESNWDSIKSLSSLTTLKLRANSLNNLPDFTLQKLTNLKNLDLYNTGMSSVTQKALHGPERSLEGINLGMNGISTMSQCAFYGFDALSQIQLSDNPLVCDCKLRWLRQWIDDRFTDFQIITTMWRCVSPAEHQNKLFVDLEADDLVCDVVVPAPECEEITTTSTTSSTTFPMTTPTPGEPDITQPPILLEFTQISANSVLVSWQIQASSDIREFIMEHREKGSLQYIEQVVIDSSEREHTLENLRASTEYVVCLTKVSAFGNEAFCSNVKTIEGIPDAEEVKGPGGTALIIGSVLGAIAFIALLVIVAFLVLRWRSGGDPFKKHFTQKKEPVLPSRTEMPRMGYNSKRFSRAKTSSTEIQNVNNTKMDNFTPEQRDMILNMMTHSGASCGSTMSMISTGSALRYVPEPPPRPPHLEGYLNPSIQDEDPDNHIYTEIGQEYEEITGAGAMGGDYITRGRPLSTISGAYAVAGGASGGNECYI